MLIVGCGRAAGLFDSLDTGKASRGVKSHAHAYRIQGQFDLVACVDTNVDRAKLFAEKFSIPNFGSDIREILKSHRIDVVSITSPDVLHFQHTLDALRHGDSVKLVFLEKPACQKPDELDRLIRESDSRNIPIVVNHSRRFNTVYKEIRRNYTNGLYGDLLRVDAHYYGGWLHNGVHLVDIIRFLFSEELENHQVIESISSGRPSDPTLTVRSELDESRVPIVLHGWHDDYYQIFDLEIRFSKGRLRIDNFETHVYWEHAVINRVGERVLSGDRVDLHQGNTTSSLIAASLIARYLEEGSRVLLQDTELKDAVNTMQIMWNIEALV